MRTAGDAPFKHPGSGVKGQPIVAFVNILFYFIDEANWLHLEDDSTPIGISDSSLFAAWIITFSHLYDLYYFLPQRNETV
jgi:hypothetical protein